MIILKYFLAFLVGGALCTVAQVLIDKTKLTPARILVLYVSFGVLLSATGAFSPLKKLVGAGITVPLTGFGGLMAEGVKRAVDSQGLLGALTGGIGSAAAGICAAILFGFLASLVFKSKPKK